MSGYNSSSQSSTIEHVNSSNSLVHLDGAGSYPGSVSSVVLDMDVPIRPHTPPASHVSSNTLTFGTFLHHHHPNSSQYGSPDSPVPFRNPGYALPQPGRLSDIDPCLHEVAGDYVSDMKTLLGEERDAKAKLAKLSNLIDNALTIDRQLSTASPVPKVT